MNSDGTLPPGVKLVPYYDRSTLVAVTTHTVLHNLIFGCLLVFVIQWVFLGNLRSAIIVGVNIPFALFFAVIIMVMMGQDANLLSVGAVDFGIIVDSAVILIENIFRNFQSPRERQTCCSNSPKGGLARSDRSAGTRTSALDRPVAADLCQRAAGRHGDFLLRPDHGRGVRAAVHHAGRRGSDFQPDGANLWLGAARRVAVDVHDHAGAGLLPLPEHVEETETIVVRALRAIYVPILRWSLEHRKTMLASPLGFLPSSAS
jgi:cobalt-zinc-cadmium resistance protein CzcA